MLISEVFPSKYLKASTVRGTKTAVIEAIETETFEGGLKPVIYFKDSQQGLVLNRSNARRLQDHFGDESDNWIGKSVNLSAEPISVRGQPVQSIVVRPTSVAAPNVDDDIPF
jgi:hypothetical protein